MLCPNVLADPAISEVSPSIMDSQGNSKGVNNPSSRSISLENKDVEDLVSSIISSKFPKVALDHACSVNFNMHTNKKFLMEDYD